MNWILSSVLLMACAWAAVGRSLESGTWEGFVTFGRGASSFSPCDSEENWWIKSKRFTTTAEELREAYNEIVEKPYEKIYARVSGEISREGQYGRLGSYKRVLYIEEILEVRARQEGDCEKQA
jgi:hypothetical protein